MRRKTELVHRKARRGERGFSLFELLVVLAILALIVGIVAPRVIGYLGSSKTRTTGIQLNYLKSALDLFLLDVGRYPTEEEGLKVLVSNEGELENWNGPYLDKSKVPTDAWGHPFRYRLTGNGQAPQVYSLGADNKEGGDGENQDIGLDDGGQTPSS